MMNAFFKRGVLVTNLLILSTFFIAGCNNQAPSAATPPAMPPMPVSVIKMQAASVPIAVEAVAQTEGAKEVEIRPRVGGIILKKMFEEGAPIKAGQTLFLIDPAPFQIALAEAKAQLAQIHARVAQTERESARLQNLLTTQSISQREYDNATSEHAMAKASVMQAEAAVRAAELNLSYTRVEAPISGVAGHFQFSEGALVAANTSLLTTVSQISPIWVRFSLSDAELAQLGGKLTKSDVKHVTLVLGDGQAFEEKGELNFSASEIDPALGTQQLRASFPNKQHQLLPGQFVRARVTTGTRDGVYLVPQHAVLTGEQGKFVFVAEQVNGKMQAQPKPIEAGSWQGNDWIVLGGLKEGDAVITDNLIKLRLGAEVNPHPAAANPEPSKP